jgi:hypothetical protein
MATLYLRSTDGSDSDNGTTWALAKATLNGIAAIDAAGDTIYVSQSHAESTAGALSIALAATTANPTKIICGNDAAEPPTAVASTATITTTGSAAITLSAPSGPLYCYGITFNMGSGANNATFTYSGGSGHFENCNFQIVATGSNTQINLANSGGRVLARNCGFKFAAASHIVQSVSGFLHIQGGSILSGGTSPTAFYSSGVTVNSNALIEDFDFSNASAGMHLVDTSSNGSGQKATFRNCKLPASWSGSLHSGTPGIAALFELYNCDAGDTRYRYRRAERHGTIQDEGTIKKSSGAGDGTDTFSWKMVSLVDAEYPINMLSTPELVKWNETTGSAITVTVDIVHDSVTALKDNEIWLEVSYLGTSGVPLGTFVSDAAATVLTTAASQTSSSATWTTTGLTNPSKLKLEVTFTPQEKGFIHAVVKLAKASTTVYLDPALQVS